MFIKQKDRIINTNNVTNITIKGDKIIFNLNYGISLRDDCDLIVPDYVYFEKDEFVENKLRELVERGWIARYSNLPCMNGSKLVNPNHISFIKFDDRKKRIIFNLDNSVSYSRDKFHRSSSFSYFDYDDIPEYEEAKEDIVDLLNGLDKLEKKIKG